MFVYNNFDGVVPAVDLTEDDKNFIAIVNKELKSFIDNNERMRWVVNIKFDQFLQVWRKSLTLGFRTNFLEVFSYSNEKEKGIDTTQ